MTTVRQTVTTVQSSRGPAAPLDNSLDALLEDLQSSVAARGGAARGGSPAVNGLANSYHRREVTRTLEREGGGGGGGGGVPQQIVHLAPANSTTVVAERSASPMLPAAAPGEARSVMYKTYSYQTYHTSSGGDSRSATLPSSQAATASASDPTSEARLQQNLNELDSLLVDLRHAQRTGFDPPPPPPQAIGNTTRTEVITTSSGIDPGLLEPLSHSTPAPPTRQQLSSTPTQQHVSRAMEYNTYRTERYTSSSADGRDRTGSTDSPRPQPKRSSSAHRELVYGVGEHVSRPRTRSPSPGYSQRQTYGEHVSRQRTRSPSPGHPQRREYVEARERYREKSPSHQRLQREVLYNETTTTSSSGGGSRSGSMRRYRDPSPPAQPRRPASPGAPQPPGADYPGGGSTRTVTTVRTYNYSGGGGGGGGGGRGRSPSPQRPPYRSPSPVSMSRPPFPLGGEDPPRGRSPSPGPRTHTTVHTYTYDGQGGPPQGYHPQPLNTVTTYKYSSSSSNTSGGPHRYPTPEEVQPLLPRPFPTPSPTPPGNQAPPKRLEDLMASFPEAEREGPPGGYYRQTTERTVTSHRGPGAVSSPSPAPAPAPPAPPAANGVGPHASAAAAAVAAADAKAREAKEAQLRAPTTNVAGPPVYYPPGVEMFAHREEAGAMQMSGRAKGKGKYKYEYESKEKSKSSQSSGAAVVPVCLPLCCAMPCVIM